MRYALVLILLSGCGPSWQERCASYGFTKGTPEFGNCMMFQQQQNAANSRRMTDDGLRLMNQSGPPNYPRNSTVCNRIGDTLVCN